MLVNLQESFKDDTMRVQRNIVHNTSTQLKAVPRNYDGRWQEALLKKLKISSAKNEEELFH